LPKQRVKRLCGPCAIGSVDAVGTTGLILGTCPGSGLGKIGAGSTGMVSTCMKWMGAGLLVIVFADPV
jgi:hypothetical protein